MMSAGKQHWWGSEAGLGDETARALQASVPSGEIRAVTPRAVMAAQALSTAIVFGVDLIWFPGNGHNVHNY